LAADMNWFRVLKRYVLGLCRNSGGGLTFTHIIGKEGKQVPNPAGAPSPCPGTILNLAIAFLDDMLVVSGVNSFNSKTSTVAPELEPKICKATTL